MGEYEYHANPLDWHKPSTAGGKGKKAGESAAFRPATAGQVGTLFNKIEVSNADGPAETRTHVAKHDQTIIPVPLCHQQHCCLVMYCACMC